MAKPQVIGFASLSDQCYPELSPRQCMVWHGDLELRENLALRNRHGIAFVIIIQEMQHIIDRQNSQPQFERSAWSDDEDEASVSFIQIQASPQMRRCQTAGQVAHTQRPSPSTSKQVIHLDRLIPPPSKVVVNFEAVQTMMNELNASECAFHQEWPENLEIPTVTQEALCALHEVTDLPPIAFHFYTDGSKTQHGAVGAGIVLLVEYPTGFAFGGALCKVVQPHGHAGVGENGAVIWALIWAVHLSNYHWRAFAQWDVHFHFHFDSVNAGYLAGGYYRTKAHKSHRILMRSMAHVLQGRHGFSRLHWLHVKAHAGNPWNELADAVARHASSFHSTHEDSEVWLAWLRDPLQLRALQWLWYLEQMNAASPYAPRIVDGFLECDIIAIPQANVPPLNCTLQTTDPVAPSPRVTIELTIATANVLTLRQSGLEQTGTSISRQQVLMQQFHDAKCTFVGIQETRHKHLVGINNELFHVIGHPADLHGNDGVQLWISKQQPLHESGPCIGKDQIRIIASSSTFLIVKINTDCWKCVIVTGRAPHSARPRQEAEAYWRTISEHLQRKASGWPLIYCGDANAHVGDCPTSAIGPLYPSQENQAGELFHQWLLQHGPYAPATFASSHCGIEHSTYRSPDGCHQARIDYVAIPLELQYQQVKSWIADDIDLSIHRTDHFAVLCQCAIDTCAQPTQRRIRQPRWDSQLLHRQLQQEATLHMLHSQVLPTPWSVDPHQTAMQLASQTTAALQQVTRHRKTWRRKSHITDATWSLIDRKKFLFKQLKQLKRARLHTMLHACFQAWHHGLKQHESVWMRSLYHDLPGWIQLHDRATAQTMQQYEPAASQVCQAVKHEDTHYYQSLADQSANTFTVEGLTGIWKHFKALLPKNRGKQQTIQYDLGASLLQHFQQLEAGVTLAQPNLYSSCVDRNNLEIQQRPASQTYDLAELPTLVEIEDHCLLQRPHKASGPDGIPSTLCRSGATAIAPQLHAMICKSFLLGVEPLCHKGGHLCALYKHKGARDDAAAYRGILLADSFAKITHAWTRQKLLPVVEITKNHRTIRRTSRPADFDRYPSSATTRQGQ